MFFKCVIHQTFYNNMLNISEVNDFNVTMDIILTFPGNEYYNRIKGVKLMNLKKMRILNFNLKCGSNMYGLPIVDEIKGNA